MLCVQHLSLAAGEPETSSGGLLHGALLLLFVAVPRCSILTFAWDFVPGAITLCGAPCGSLRLAHHYVPCSQQYCLVRCPAPLQHTQPHCRHVSLNVYCCLAIRGPRDVLTEAMTMPISLSTSLHGRDLEGLVRVTVELLASSYITAGRRDHWRAAAHQPLRCL